MINDNGDSMGVAGGRSPLFTIHAGFDTAFITQTTPLIQVLASCLLPCLPQSGQPLSALPKVL